MNGNNWFDKLKLYECPDSTMNSTQPVVIAKAKGSLLWDCQNKKYIDLCAGFGSLALGHNHPNVRKYLASSENGLIQGMGDVFASTDKIALLTELQNFLPFAKSEGALLATGSQAIEFALKTSHLYTKKDSYNL